MSGHFAWWANRKSKIGLSPAACPAPHFPNGNPWWTTPPVAVPQPEHIEFAVQYLLEVQRRPPNRETQALVAHVSAWLRTVRQLLHEHIEADQGELHTTDGLIIAAERTFYQLKSQIIRLGGEIEERWEQVHEALRARSHEARRRRATSRLSAPISAPTRGPGDG